MTRDDVLERLRTERKRFDDAVAAVPPDRLDDPQATGTHSVKDIVAHVNAYEELIVERLEAARRGETTSFDRDRVGWQEFNDRIWREAREMSAEDVFEGSRTVFAELLEQVARLTDAELEETTGVTTSIDPAWLQGRPLSDTIAVDAFDHYPMHLETLRHAAAG